MTNIPLFGSSASLISPPDGTVTSGYFPLQYYPAEHLNYYTNATTQAVQEIVSLIQAVGLSPSSSVQLPTTISGILSGLAPTISKLAFNLPSSTVTLDPSAIVRGIDQGLLYTWVSNTSFSIGAGCRGNDTFVSTMYLASALTKTTSVWAVGSAAGGLDTGSIAANTWYYIFLIKRPDTGVVDILFSTSPTAPTMPTDYTLKRLFQAVKTNGSNQFIQTLCYADGTQEWLVPFSDVNDATLTTAKKSYPLLSAPNVFCRVSFFTAAANAVVGARIQIYGNTNLTDSADSTNPPNAVLTCSVGAVGQYIVVPIMVISGTLYARSSGSSTTLVATSRDFNIRPFC